MNDNLRLFAKVSGRSAAAWLKIALLGGIFAFGGFITGIVLLANNTGGGFAGAGHTGLLGAVLGAFVLFATEFWTALLLFGSLGCAVFYLAFANKYALHTTISQLWQEKLGDQVLGKAAHYLDALSQRQPNWLRATGDGAKVKLQLLQAVKDDKEANALQRKALSYAFKKVSLDDTDFSRDETTLTSIIIQKLHTKLAEASAPSTRPFWIVAGIQLLVLVLAIVFDHH